MRGGQKSREGVKEVKKNKMETLAVTSFTGGTILQISINHHGSETQKFAAGTTSRQCVSATRVELNGKKTRRICSNSSAFDTF